MNNIYDGDWIKRAPEMAFCILLSPLPRSDANIMKRGHLIGNVHIVIRLPLAQVELQPHHRSSSTRLKENLSLKLWRREEEQSLLVLPRALMIPHLPETVWQNGPKFATCEAVEGVFKIFPRCLLMFSTWSVYF